jgi:hypothetical protein
VMDVDDAAWRALGASFYLEQTKGLAWIPAPTPLAAAGRARLSLPTDVQSIGVLEKHAEVTHKIGVQHCGYLPCILFK